MSVPYVIEKSSKGEERVYDLYSRLLKDRIVFIRGTFTQDLSDAVVAQLLYLESVDDSSDIHMYINSPGGQVDCMYAIYDTMQYIKPDITTLGMGTVASAASFILAAGAKGKRYSLENASLMMHELSTQTSGKYNEMVNSFKHTEYMYDKMASHYSEFTGQSIEKIKEDMKKDYFMSAEEAKEYGLVDEIRSCRK